MHPRPDGETFFFSLTHVYVHDVPRVPFPLVSGNMKERMTNQLAAALLSAKVLKKKKKRSKPLNRFSEPFS